MTAELGAVHREGEGVWSNATKGEGPCASPGTFFTVSACFAGTALPMCDAY